MRILSGARWTGPDSRGMRSHIIQITLILAVAQAHLIITTAMYITFSLINNLLGMFDTPYSLFHPASRSPVRIFRLLPPPHQMAMS